MLVGPTGTGKTKTGIEIAQKISEAEGNSKPLFLVVCPSKQGALPAHWKEELVASGIPRDNVAFVTEKDLPVRIAEWRRTPEWRGPFVVIATYCQVHSEVSDKKGKGTVLRDDRFPFDHITIDESHNYRNGSDPRSDEDVDEKKLRYASMAKVTEKHERTAHVLLLTATPQHNSRMDLYSQAVLMNAMKRRKAAWKRNATAAQWNAERNHFIKNHVLFLNPPEDLARKDALVQHGPVVALITSVAELNGAAECNKELRRKIHTAQKMIGMLQHGIGTVEQQQQLLQIVNNCIKSCGRELGRARRGLLHPVFYEKPPNGGKVTADDFRKYAHEDASKFNVVVEELRRFKGRVLITSQFSQPLDFLKLHLAEYAKEWTVLLHHGGVKCTNVLQEFKRLGEEDNSKVALLATTGSCGEGVNFSMTTNQGKDAVRLLCLDLPLTHAEQQQLEGRIKRPFAQPNVEHWHVHYIFSKIAVLHGCPSSIHTRETMDHALRRLLQEKEQSANELFRSDEERAEQIEGETVTAQTVARTLGALRLAEDVCNSWIPDETPAEKVARCDGTMTRYVREWLPAFEARKKAERRRLWKRVRALAHHKHVFWYWVRYVADRKEERRNPDEEMQEIFQLLGPEESEQNPENPENPVPDMDLS